MGKSVMYYDDLTKFIYLKFLHPNDLPPDLLNIGWLDSEHVFPTDKIDPLVLPVIKKMVFNERSLHMTRGYYFCPFCTISHPIENHPVPASIELGGQEKSLGSGTIIIQGKTHAYAFPNLLYHYISDHKYKPPHVFIDDVLSYY
ncbi:hypothetical protein MNBD_GAMMA10-1635 [hydrothermal vent metagenome]|uniref:DUF7919 domain-containing protein n=1 Tax=hydrothermal vent metagenome TaxID=652676 RepID=A0A3B0Y3K9_9ZZZZ